MARRGPKAPEPEKPTITMRMTDDEVKSCKEAFDLFDLDGGGTIDPSEINAALSSLGNSGSPTIFRLLGGIEHLGADIEFESFLEHINEKLGHRESKEGVANIMELFDDDGTNSINVSNMVRVARELGETMSEDELKAALEKCSGGKPELNLDDFYKVMTKKINV